MLTLFVDQSKAVEKLRQFKVLETMINRNIDKKETMLNYFKRISFKTFMNEL
jgi:hypothetical protein